MDYQARIDNKMDKIAQIIDRLEHTLAELNECDGRVKCFYEQRKALHEIHSVLRKTDDIQELKYDWMQDDLNAAGAAAGADMAGIGYADGVDAAYGVQPNPDLQTLPVTQEDRQLDKINSTMTKLDDTMANLDDSDDKVKSFIEQKKALHEIKKLLKEAGHYDGFVPEDSVFFEEYDSIQ